MPSSSEDLTFAKITSEGKGRKTVNLKTTMISDRIKIVERGATEQPQSKELTRIPKKTVSIPDLALSHFRQVEHADAEADVVKDAVGVLRVQLVDEGLLWG
jgi:hypothetical protein